MKGKKEGEETQQEDREEGNARRTLVPPAKRHAGSFELRL